MEKLLAGLWEFIKKIFKSNSGDAGTNSNETNVNINIPVKTGGYRPYVGPQEGTSIDVNAGSKAMLYEGKETSMFTEDDKEFLYHLKYNSPASDEIKMYHVDGYRS